MFSIVVKCVETDLLVDLKNFRILWVENFVFRFAQ